MGGVAGGGGGEGCDGVFVRERGEGEIIGEVAKKIF